MADLRARASPAPQAQQPGSAFVQVTRQSPGRRRQTTTLGYLSYNAARGVFQVGDSGSAVSFAPPQPKLDQGGLQITSPGLAGNNMCATTTLTGPNGNAAATNFIIGMDPGYPDSGTRQCFFWSYLQQTQVLMGRNQYTRDPYTFAVDPSTSDLYAWTGATDDKLPPAAQRVTLTLVYQTVAQPVVAAGGSYQALLRLSKRGQASYQYAEWREFPAYGISGFWPTTMSEAVVFTISPAPTNSSRVQLQFTFNGVLKTAGLRTTTAALCADGSNIQCAPGADFSATPSIADSSDPTNNPILTDAFTYPSYAPYVNGLIGHVHLAAQYQGQPTTLDFDVAFSNPGNKISADSVGPTRRGSDDQYTIDIIPL